MALLVPTFRCYISSVREHPQGVLSFFMRCEMDKPLKLCKASGCPNLTRNKYCEEHQYLQAAEDEKRIQYLRSRQTKDNRKSSTQRGYDSKWQRYSKWFLAQPGHQVCALHYEGCTIVAECVDHIDPPKDRHDPKFWDFKNHQPSCIHCNSVKGHRKDKGNFKLE